MSLDLYLENPEWSKFYNYAQSGAPNDGFYKRWIQGSVGGTTPMHLYSNEYSHLYMKFGQNDPIPYHGNLKPFSPTVNDDIMGQVSQCSYSTTNPVGCQVAGIRKVFTYDNSPKRYATDTPHPYGVSYVTGYQPYEVQLPPDDPYQQ